LATDRAFAISSGDYIVKLEGDEQYAPGWLDQAVRAMELFPEIGQLSLMQFGVADWARTPQERVRYPDWDSFVLKEFQREGVKIAVVWCSPGGQFMVRRKLWKETGDWYQGHPDQETIAFRMRLCPMARLLKGFDPQRPPPEDKEAHWEQYKDTPWLAVLDPPVLSTHWGSGRTLLFKAQKTLLNQPVLSYKGGTPNYSVQRGDRFGPMPSYNSGKDLP
jgi:hypothetical protein